MKRKLCLIPLVAVCCSLSSCIFCRMTQTEYPKVTAKQELTGSPELVYSELRFYPKLYGRNYYLCLHYDAPLSDNVRYTKEDISVTCQGKKRSFKMEDNCYKNHNGYRHDVLVCFRKKPMEVDTVEVCVRGTNGVSSVHLLVDGNEINVPYHVDGHL